MRWPAIVRRVDEACARGARLVVLPEGTVPAYVLGLEPVDPQHIVDAQRDLADCAQRHGATIVYGAARIIEGRTYNTATTIGPAGEVLGAPQKSFLWHFDRRWFARGEQLEPVDTPVGRLGILVCADGRIPLIARTLVERGAEILVMPTAWVTSGRDPGALENIQADLFVTVRAHENRVPFVVANKAGVERGAVAYCGKSAIVDRDGAFVARASEREEELCLGEVALGDRDRALHPSARAAAPLPAEAEPAARRTTRIAITTANGPAELDELATLAGFSDVELLLAPGDPSKLPPSLQAVRVPSHGAEPHRDGLVTFVSDSALRDPAALVPLRLSGCDLFVVGDYDDDAFGARYARTRAAELRAYVVALDVARGRAFACDPDGTVIAGTFGEYRMAQFVYDPARSGATQVAPATDVLAGLRAVVAQHDAARGIFALARQHDA